MESYTAAPAAVARGAGAAPGALGWIALSLALLLFHGLSISFLNDDAFISFRFAENWVNGDGLVFNPGERVEGYTNFLWTILIGLFLRIGADPLTVSRVLGAAASAMTLLVALRLAARVAPPGARPSPLAPLLLAASTPFAYWSFAGLEGPLFALLLALALERQLGGRSAAPIGLLLGLLALTRPEGVAFFGLFLLYRVARGRGRGVGGTLRGELAFCLAFSVVFVPYFLWRFSYYGYLLPNTFYVRQGRTLAQNLDLYRNGALYLLAFFRDGGGLLLAAPLLLLRRRARPGVGLLVGLIAFWCAYMVAVGGDSKIFFRFFVPVLPLILVLAAEALREVTAALEPAARGGWRARASTASIVALLLLLLATPSVLPPEKYRIDRTFFAMMAEGGKWLARFAPPDATVACFAVGALPYYAKLPTYDLLGVTDPHIAHGPLRKGQMTGHGKTDWRYIMAKEPTYIFPMGNPDLAGGKYEFAPISVNVQGEVLQLRAWRRRGG